MIRLLEEGGQIDQFSGDIKRVGAVIDGMWNKVSFIAVGDVPDHVDQFEEYADQLMRLDDSLREINGKKEQLMDTITASKGEDAAMEFDGHVEGMIHDVQVKLNRLEVLLDNLMTISKVIASTSKEFPSPIDVT
jgi:hypothetical protein